MTPTMVEKELWVCLLAYNLIRLLMARAAHTATQCRYGAVGRPAPSPANSLGSSPSALSATDPVEASPEFANGDPNPSPGSKCPGQSRVDRYVNVVIRYAPK
jgi:hypothetical protein